MTAWLGRQGPPSDPGRDGCGPPWAMFAAALTFLAVLRLHRRPRLPRGDLVTADILALLSPQTPDTWPQGILAAADLREQRAKAATPGPYVPYYTGVEQSPTQSDGTWPALTICDTVVSDRPRQAWPNAEHIAAEASPAHALAAVRHWRGVVERHTPMRIRSKDGRDVCQWCDGSLWPCDDLTETADEARAYLGGTE